MIHPNTKLEFISEEKGYGVVATTFIPKGTITWALDSLDQVFTKKEVLSMNPLLQNIIDVYSFRNNKSEYILCWDNGRFVNHSFKSNCLATAYDFEIAIRDILPGEELTDDYGYLNMEEKFRGIDEHTKRKIVYPDDLLKYHKVWDAKILKVLPISRRIEQPLYSLISEEAKEAIKDILDGKVEMKSTINMYAARK